VTLKVGALRHSIVLENPAAAVADGDGGYTQAFTDLTPSPVQASIVPASARDLERVAAGTVLSTATHVVTMRYHSGVTTKTRITFGTRTFNVVGVMNPEERNLWTVAVAVEVVS
jgi:SPP1 family predicted phage head-tail adaptor